MTPNAIIGGSHAYGIPRTSEFQTKSDVDLVILMTEEEATKLNELSDCPHAELRFDSRSFPLRFGNLNLIVCTDPDKFELWHRGIEDLKAIAPVNRPDAIAFFKALFAEHGFPISENESG